MARWFWRVAVGSLVVGVVTTGVVALVRSEYDHTRSGRVEAVRTTSDGRGLVLSYVGTPCDRSARVEVRETTTEVDVTVRVRERDSVCGAAGTEATAIAALTQPLGTRAVRTPSDVVTPFDGRLVLDLPSAPAGTSRRSEVGRFTGVTTTGWAIEYLAPQPADPDSCQAGPGEVRVTTSDSRQTTNGLTAAGSVTVRGTTGSVLEQIGSIRLVTWSEGERTVSVESLASCTGELRSTVELTALANSSRAVRD